MATDTIMIKDIIENYFILNQKDELFPSHKEKIQEGKKNIFDFDYPIFDEDYRNVFETHFIREFYMREIGFETVGAFKFRLETWLIINMPYYNKLFESELIKFDPFVNSKVDVEHTKKSDKNQNDNRDTTKQSQMDEDKNSTVNQTSNTTDDLESEIDRTGNVETDTTTDVEGETNRNEETTVDDFERDIKSDNPDDRLALTTNDGEGVIEYATNIDERTRNNKDNKDIEQTDSEKTVSNSATEESSNQKGKETNVSDTTLNSEENETTGRTNEATQNDKLVSDINELEDFVQHRTGKIGVQSYSKMLMEYRESFLRIEKRMFEEMQELFMLTYDFY